MREIYEDGGICDDEFDPIQMSIDEGFHGETPTTFYAIELEVDFDEKFDDIIADFGLDVTGYMYQSIFECYLEEELPQLVETLQYDSEGSTYVAYADSEENQRIIAAKLQKFCGDYKLLRKTIKANLKYLEEAW